MDVLFKVYRTLISTTSIHTRLRRIDTGIALRQDAHDQAEDYVEIRFGTVISFKRRLSAIVYRLPLIIRVICRFVLLFVLSNFVLVFKLNYAYQSQAQNAAALFLWGKQRKMAVTPAAYFSLQHPKRIVTQIILKK